MSLYASKSGNGDWLGANSIIIAEWADDLALAAKYSHQKDANHDAKIYGAKAVPLGEKSTPVVVSTEEAEMLDEAKTAINPMHVLWMNELVHNGDSEGQNRLMRAYVIGWTVEKPKRWNVKVPHVNNGYYYKDSDGLAVFTAKRGRMLQERSQFTAAEIEENGLQDCEKVEVEENGGLDK